MEQVAARVVPAQSAGDAGMGQNRETAANKGGNQRGGNRAGGTKKLEAQAAKAGSRQAAGKDPDRGKKAKRPTYN